MRINFNVIPFVGQNLNTPVRNAFPQFSAQGPLGTLFGFNGIPQEFLSGGGNPSHSASKKAVSEWIVKSFLGMARMKFEWFVKNHLQMEIVQRNFPAVTDFIKTVFCLG